MVKVLLEKENLQAPEVASSSKAKMVMDPCSHPGARRDRGTPVRLTEKDSLEVVLKRGATNLVFKELSAVV